MTQSAFPRFIVATLWIWLLGGLAPAQAQRTKRTPAPTPEPVVVAKPSKEFAKYGKYLCVIEGDAGKGSGAFIKLRGAVLFSTNAHVLSGNSRFRAQMLDGKEIPNGKLGIAKGRDIAVMEVKGYTDGIEVMDDVERNATIGDDVVVLGNSLGGQVVTEITGKITGIGPEFVEVDAKFVKGNSGCPVIHVKSGKVVGIATYAVPIRMNPIAKDSKFANVEFRRLCYRFDTVNEWQYPTMQTFLNTGLALRKMEKLDDDLFALLNDIADDGIVIPTKHQAPENRFRRHVTDFCKLMERKDLAPQSAQEAKMRFLREIAFLSGPGEWAALAVRGADDYHVREYQKADKTRGTMRREVEHLSNKQDAVGKITLP
jgi:hypothetical protein